MPPEPYRIVYFLGAGFSAPLGLPVMSNFMGVARDLHEARPQETESFKEVFTHIRELHAIKQFMAFDLENIEHILSLLEMGSAMGQNALPREAYTEFLKAVVTATTPRFKISADCVTNVINGSSGKIAREFNLDVYLKFGAWFLGRYIELSVDTGRVLARFPLEPSVNYRVSFITLNYDMVLESLVAALTEHSEFKMEIRKQATETIHRPLPNEMFIAKLHGSLDTVIVPPTWNKTPKPEIEKAWTLARILLAQAHEIRFIGYSLPESDAYIKYLLAVAVQENKNLKRIQIINKQKEAVSRFKTLFKPYEDRTEEFIEDAMGRLPTATLHLNPGSGGSTPIVSLQVRSMEELPRRISFS